MNNIKALTESNNIQPPTDRHNINTLAENKIPIICETKRINVLPFTEGNLTTLLNKEDQESLARNKPMASYDIHIAMPKVEYCKMREIIKSINFNNSNKTKVEAKLKNVDATYPTCIGCGLDISKKDLVLPDCRHVTCIPCYKEVIDGNRYYECQYSICNYQCPSIDIDSLKDIKIVSLEGRSNLLISNLSSLERSIQCKVYYEGRGYNGEFMPLEDAFREYYKSSLIVDIQHRCVVHHKPGCRESAPNLAITDCAWTSSLDKKIQNETRPAIEFSSKSSEMFPNIQAEASRAPSKHHIMQLNEMPLTSSSLRTLLNETDQEYLAKNNMLFNDEITVRVEHMVYSRIKRITESVDFNNSNKTKIKEEQKKSYRPYSSCCECGLKLFYKVIVLPECSHAICIHCYIEKKSYRESNPDNTSAQYYKCPFYKVGFCGNSESTPCGYKCHLDNIDCQEDTENVSIEGKLNCSFINLPSIDENIPCQIFINNDVVGDFIPLKAAYPKYYNLTSRP